MKAGELRHRITIQQNAPTVNDYGERADNWVTLMTVWAAIEPMAGNERWLKEVEADVAMTTTRIRMRYYPGVSAAMRVKHGETIYEVTAVINLKERDREMWLMATEISGGADGGNGC